MSNESSEPLVAEIDPLADILVTAEHSPSESPQQPQRRRPGRPRKSESGAEAPEFSSAGKPRATRRVSDPSKQVARDAGIIREKLVAIFTFAGTGASMVLPVTGTTLAMRAGLAADGLIDAAKANATVAEWLLRLLDVGAYSNLVMFAGTMVVAVMVDVKMLPANSLPAQMIIPDVIAKFIPPEMHSPNGAASNTEPISSRV